MKKYRITVVTEQGEKRYKVKAQQENIGELAKRMSMIPFTKDEDGYCAPSRILAVRYKEIGG